MALPEETPKPLLPSQQLQQLQELFAQQQSHQNLQGNNFYQNPLHSSSSLPPVQAPSQNQQISSLPAFSSSTGAGGGGLGGLGGAGAGLHQNFPFSSVGGGQQQAVSASLQNDKNGGTHHSQPAHVSPHLGAPPSQNGGSIMAGGNALSTASTTTGMGLMTAPPSSPGNTGSMTFNHVNTEPQQQQGAGGGNFLPNHPGGGGGFYSNIHASATPAPTSAQENSAQQPDFFGTASRGFTSSALAGSGGAGGGLLQPPQHSLGNLSNHSMASSGNGGGGGGGGRSTQIEDTRSGAFMGGEASQNNNVGVVGGGEEGGEGRMVLFIDYPAAAFALVPEDIKNFLSVFGKVTHVRRRSEKDEGRRVFHFVHSGRRVARVGSRRSVRDNGHAMGTCISMDRWIRRVCVCA